MTKNSRRRNSSPPTNGEPHSSYVYRSSSTVQQRTNSSSKGRTRMSKRKHSPEKIKHCKRARGSELAHSSSSSEEDCTVRGTKRKAQEDGEGPSKKRGCLELEEDDEKSSSSCMNTESSSWDCSKNEGHVWMRKGKRKVADDGQGPSRKKKKILDQVDTKRAEFKAKYVEQDELDKGGFASVFAGYRKEDNFPVAIKHIPKENIVLKVPYRKRRRLSTEVAVMRKLSAGTPMGTSAPVSLLDWFDLGEELILVLERPLPCMDLFEYKMDNGGPLSEEKAKVILKQLVNAAKELQDKGIFHRDIKMENILIETGSNNLRVRLIDFGLSCFVKERSLFRIFYGTRDHVAPEFYFHSKYRAEPITVWQLGVVLYEILHQHLNTTKFLSQGLQLNSNLSKDCRDFLKMCLAIFPIMRPTLEELLLHPWLR